MAVVVVAASPRMKLKILNAGRTPAYLGFDGTVTEATGFQLPPRCSFEPVGRVVSDAVFAVSAHDLLVREA